MSHPTTTMRKSYPSYLAVTDKSSGEPATRVAIADAATIERAIAAAGVLIAGIYNLSLRMGK
jgi:hypothetical protein